MSKRISTQGLRLKHSGMGLSLRGANAILYLGCATPSRRLDNFWEDHAV
ncbi:MAG: hypothetical protein IT394_01040 [Candidatus Omnitrophica bacterium]|nr:hypothetical protein [bacterium]MCC6731787.1 hypothetical protein [Candidatus Omnitrophota bacterium]